MFRKFILVLVVSLSLSIIARAQSSAFTYQGRLSDNGTQPTATYAMEFRLFGSSTGDDQIGEPLTFDGVGSHPAPVPVANGGFTVQLNFGGAAAFDGNARWLQIAVKKPTDSSFVTLNHRQPLTSTPYAIKSLNAASADIASNSTQLGGVAASEYVVTTDSRMNDARTPTAGSSDYIQNNTSIQPQASSFNISGSGTVGDVLNANIVDARTQYNIFGPSVGHSVRLMSVSGFAETNTFLGRDAAKMNPSGNFNSFFGNGAGLNTQGGGNNSFFGSGSGDANQSGLDNSFFGRNAGFASTGSNNTFVGSFAGSSNTNGDSNTIIGRGANVSSSNPSNATAIGALAMVTQNNSLVLGSIAGTNGATADTNVGIGTTAPSFRLHVIDPSNKGLRVEINVDRGTVASFGAKGSFFIDGPGPFTEQAGGGRLFVREDGKVEINNDLQTPTQTKLYVNGGVIVTGLLSVHTLDSGGTTSLCLNSNHSIATCSSSLRYKNNINNFSPGLDLIRRLRPVSFNWKANNQADMGLVAEEVAALEPLLVTHNDKGEVEGVKYDRVGVVLINAVKEQQAQIEDQRTLIRSQQQLLETQQRQIEQQQRQVDALKTLVCSMKASADICKKEQ